MERNAAFAAADAVPTVLLREGWPEPEKAAGWLRVPEERPEVTHL